MTSAEKNLGVPFDAEGECHGQSLKGDSERQGMVPGEVPVQGALSLDNPLRRKRASMWALRGANAR